MSTGLTQATAQGSPRRQQLSVILERAQDIDMYFWEVGELSGR